MLLPDSSSFHYASLSTSPILLRKVDGPVSVSSSAFVVVARVSFAKCVAIFRLGSRNAELNLVKVYGT